MHTTRGYWIGAKDKVSDCGVVIKFVERGWWLAVCNIAFVLVKGSAMEDVTCKLGRCTFRLQVGH